MDGNELLDQLQKVRGEIKELKDVLVAARTRLDATMDVVDAMSASQVAVVKIHPESELLQVGALVIPNGIKHWFSVSTQMIEVGIVIALQPLLVVSVRGFGKITLLGLQANEFMVVGQANAEVLKKCQRGYHV